jgi:hypothetical protein
MLGQRARDELLEARRAHDHAPSVLLTFLLSLTHGLGPISLKGHGTWKVLLATHAIAISFKRRRIRCRSWFHTIHSALHAASRGSGDCSSSLLLLDTHYLKRLL